MNTGGTFNFVYRAFDVPWDDARIASVLRRSVKSN